MSWRDRGRTFGDVFSLFIGLTLVSAVVLGVLVMLLVVGFYSLMWVTQ